MKFKEGQLVRIKTFKERPITWAMDGAMDHMMGQILPIYRVGAHGVYIVDKECGFPFIFEFDHVEPVTEKIVIYRDGRTVIAKNLATGENAIAKCSPEDKFNFETGAKLAFDRLVCEKQAPTQPAEKVYNGKLCCVKGHKPYFTEGKIYKVKDGRIEDNLGQICPKNKKFRDMDHIKDYFTPNAAVRVFWPDATTIEFIEVVE